MSEKNFPTFQEMSSEVIDENCDVPHTCPFSIPRLFGNENYYSKNNVLNTLGYTRRNQKQPVYRTTESVFNRGWSKVAFSNGRIPYHLYPFDGEEGMLNVRNINLPLASDETEFSPSDQLGLVFMLRVIDSCLSHFRVRDINGRSVGKYGRRIRYRYGGLLCYHFPHEPSEAAIHDGIRRFNGDEIYGNYLTDGRFTESGDLSKYVGDNNFESILPFFTPRRDENAATTVPSGLRPQVFSDLVGCIRRSAEYHAREGEDWSDEAYAQLVCLVLFHIPGVYFGYSHHLYSLEACVADAIVSMFTWVTNPIIEYDESGGIIPTLRPNLSPSILQQHGDGKSCWETALSRLDVAGTKLRLESMGITKLWTGGIGRGRSREGTFLNEPLFSAEDLSTPSHLLLDGRRLDVSICQMSPLNGYSLHDSLRDLIVRASVCRRVRLVEEFSDSDSWELEDELARVLHLPRITSDDFSLE